MTLIELYQSQGANGENGESSRVLLTQTHWFMVNSDFDPKTGEALPQALSAFLAKVGGPKTVGTLHDRLWRITEHARSSVHRLIRTLNESPRREQAMLPVRAVRELDANSFIKLSNRPGRNIREKLAGKPYLQAVCRFQSIDLPENRLLKAFVARLAELLELRQDCLAEEEDELLPKIQSWLLSDDAHAIARWDNLPPNNTLLSHRDYRLVWDAWRWLQTLDDDIARDFSQLEVRNKTMRLWNEYGRMYYNGTHRFAEIPVLFDYENFEIRPWLLPLAIQPAKWEITRSLIKKEILEPVCVDLAGLRPRYSSTKDQTLHSLHDAYIWQHWKDDEEGVDIELFNSDAAYLHPDTTTISSSDVFYSKDNDLIDRAARAFASRLREVFKNDTFIWLVPDFLNDFEVEAVRRNLNARFPNAEPLPRSVAAVFEQIDYSKVSQDGFAKVVVDSIGGKTCVTKLIARHDPGLKKRLPETNGFYWERCPEVIIPPRDTGRAEGKARQSYDITTVDSQGQWNDRVRPEKPELIDPETLKRNPRIGQFEDCIKLSNSPVTGGIRLHALQQRAGDIPLWRDQIPELSIKVKKDGRYQRFYLVSRGTTVNPIRGLPVAIPVQDTFKLPSGRPFYQFPLFQGENADELGFSARLNSPAFPLKTDTVCKLNLIFEYGADEPYKLIFEPLDKSFPPVRATWRQTGETIITDASAPGYPTPMSWPDLRRAPKPNGKETSNLLEWVLGAIDRFVRPRKRTVGKIDAKWLKDKNAKYFTFAECDKINTSVFIHEHSLVDGLHYDDFGEGDEVSFEWREDNGKFSAHRVAKANYEEEPQDLVKRLRESLYVPFIQVWRDGRSIADRDCPKAFAIAARNSISAFADLLRQPDLPNPVKYELLFLFACLHKDTTDDCVQWVTEQVNRGRIHDPQAVGFALGDVSEEWQQRAFSRLASTPSPSAISVFAYAIWREQHFVERFSVLELQAAVDALLCRLEKINSVKRSGDGNGGYGINRDWVRATAETLELLLGLLRTRSSTNLQIKMFLQPHQKITKELAKQVERATEIVTQSNVNLFSRVQLNIPKPAGDRTPDLLYALRLYLTGDDGANDIHIISVSDNDND